MVFVLPKKTITENGLIKLVSSYNPFTDVEKLRKAYRLCIKWHGEQKRLSGEPYYTHPITVAYYIANMQMDDVAIVSALLHDVLEDTDVTADEIEKEFGAEVSEIVVGLTKMYKLKFQPQQVKQLENFRRLFLAMSKDIRIIIIKFCDRLHNMQTLNLMPQYKKVSIATETLDLFVPLAERLGMYKIKNKLEDLSFMYLNPTAKESLEKQIKAIRTKYSKAIGYKDVIAVMAELIKSTIKDQGLDVEVIGREKSPYSLWKKMLVKKRDLATIADVFAFRIIVDSVFECYQVLGIVHQHYNAIPGAFKDYISTPRQNGYQSIHTVIFGPFKHRIEVQIRTKEMDLFAKNGPAAHWSYKQDMTNKDFLSRNQRMALWIEKVLELVRDENPQTNFLEAATLEMSSNQIFAFTPKGEIINLPYGATILDFAFAIHSELGMRCEGGVIKGTRFPYNHRLCNGDTISVIKAKKNIAKVSWMNDCVSARAKSFISKLTKLEQLDNLKTEGAGIIRNLLVEIQKELTTESLDLLLKASGLKCYDDMYIQLAKSMLDPLVLIKRAFPYLSAADKATNFDNTVKTTEPVKIFMNNSFRSINSLRNPNSVNAAFVNGLIQEEEDSLRKTQQMIGGVSKNLAMEISACCCPKYGDAIVGLISPSSPLMVHHANCHVLDFIILDEQNTAKLWWKRVVNY